MMGQHVFISYKHDDRVFANQLIHRVQTARFKVWIDDEQLRAGENWREAINHAIRESFALVLVISPEARISEYVTYEWAFAQGAGVKVIPVMLRPTPMLHPQLEVMQYLDFTDPMNMPWDRLLERLREVRGEYKPHTISLAQDAPRAVIQAIEALDNPRAEERRAALRSLAQMNHPSAYSALVEAVQHPLRDVRVDAAFMLAKQTNNTDFAAVPGLIEALSDEDARIRGAAVKTLGEIGDPESVAYLIEIINKERDGNIRWLATGALSKMGKAAVPGLIEALHDEDWKVRRSVCEALWGMNEPSAVPGLVEALLDRNDVVRQAAGGALEALGIVAVPGLSEALRDRNRRMAQAAAELLMRMDTDEARAALRSWQR
ncbi:MAG: HEAT repeat domain-containing protein [Anaerolineae bacterium]|nr:HEAT repeat domain-containing protein [Anaerolineae bacterium]